MLDKAINEIYTNVIKIVLDGINILDREKVANSYLQHLYSLYSDKDFNEQNYAKMVSVITEIEQSKWSLRDKKSKLYYFKTDNSFDIIDSLSKKAYSLALSRYEKNIIPISKEEADKNIDTLIKKLESVEDFNKEEAERLVSEGILDFNYACGSNSDIISFRLSHIQNKKNRH